jgi:hypothetical protein
MGQAYPSPSLPYVRYDNHCPQLYLCGEDEKFRFQASIDEDGNAHLGLRDSGGP